MRISKKALVTGISGQDGSYLAELLLEQGYEVFGTVLPARTPNLGNARHLADKIRLIPLDLRDQASVDESIREVQPDEIYNLAADTFVPQSWEDPAKTTEVTGIGPARLLASLRRHRPQARFCQASSAQIFGKPAEVPQTEATPVRPLNPYGAAKAYAHFLTAAYRESGLFACSAILFNHESPRRGPEFVTRKITRAAAEIKLGLAKEISLGSLDSRRDWGYAGDYVKAMWLMLQQPSADDYVLATGRAHSVQEWAEIAFRIVGLRFEDHLVKDPSLLRVTDADVLTGNPAKADRVLGWRRTVDFEELIERMVKEDLRLLSRPATGSFK